MDSFTKAAVAYAKALIARLRVTAVGPLTAIPHPGLTDAQAELVRGVVSCGFTRQAFPNDEFEKDRQGVIRYRWDRAGLKMDTHNIISILSYESFSS